MPEQSSLERTFGTYWITLCQGFPEPVCEYRFTPPRKFKFDLAWPELKIAVELEGGVYSGGRHTRGKGFEGDCEKYNLAAEQGWLVLRYTTNMLKSNPHKVMEQIQKNINRRGVKQ